MNTTLNRIRSHYPSRQLWEKLLGHLGKTKADNESLPLATILKVNGLDDAIWCLRAVPKCDRKARLYAVWCVRQVQHLMIDPRSLAALDVAERHANNEATDQELAAARDAARDAAWAADEYAASEAARHAVWDAVDAAADAAAQVAGWAAARDAASAAADDAARSAARDAARQEQEKKFIEMFCLGESK
jgi:hypothetical protein